jgi:hypothetical protein
MFADMTSPHRGAMHPNCVQRFAPKNKGVARPLSKGVGNAGCPLHPQPRAQSVESTRVQPPQVHRDHPAFPHAMVLTVSFVLSPVIGLSCHRRWWKCFRQLDAGVEASGPHDLAVREPRPRQSAARVHRIPRPTSVTIAIRPSPRARDSVR